MFRRREKVEAKPVCIHEWHLIDASVHESYNGYDVDFYKKVTVACPKCDTTKTMDELEYMYFSRMLDVKE